jgi:hypothetical protein
MCQKTSLKGSHEKRKYQFCTKAKDERQKAKDKRQKPLAFSLQIGGESNKATKQHLKNQGITPADALFHILWQRG